MTGQNGILAGRRGLVIGTANERSLAWGIAKQASLQGAELAFTFQDKALEKRVRPLAESTGSNIIEQCDVTDSSSLDNLFNTLKSNWDNLDFVLHAVAFSDKNELRGKYINTSRKNFAMTMDISCFSFTDICRRSEPLMKEGGSLLTLTYYGAERVIPHYNVMGVAKAALEASVRYLARDMGSKGIRVNGLSAGPAKTLAASGVGDFRYILKWNELNSPMQRNVTLEDVGRSGAYLLSNLSSGVTGEVHHVDCGYHIVGMLEPESSQEISDLLGDVSLSE